MSEILDIPIHEGMLAMAFEEKGAWVALIVGIVAYTVYLAVVLTRAAGGDLPATPYVDALLWSIGAAIVAGIVVTIAVSIITRRDGLESDQRDKQISARAEHTARAFLVIGALGALVLALLEAEPFWIANTIYLAFVVSGTIEGITRIALYRGVMPAW